MKRRFEFAEGASSKFWEVEVAGADVTNNIACEPELWDPKTKVGVALDGLESKLSAQLRRLAKYREKHGE